MLAMRPAYFLSKYSRAELIAIEPDTRNFEVFKQNLAAYGSRAKAIRSAIWSHRTGLTVCRGGVSSEWTSAVRESTSDEIPDVHAVDIASLLRESGHRKIDILTVDIEGAGQVVFSRNYETWIDTIRLFVIELHNSHCAEAFHRALGSGSFTISQSRELTIAHRTP